MGDTTERGLPMRPPPPNLDPTLMLRLIPGTGTTGTATTDHTDMGTMALATGDTTGEKVDFKNNIKSFPADSSLKRQFLQNNFLFSLFKNSFVLCIRVPGTVFNYLQSRNNKI